MKKIIAFILAMMIVSPLTIDVTNAYPGGLLDGMPGWTCSNDGDDHDCSSVPTYNATDGNLETFVPLQPASSNPNVVDWLIFDLPKAMQINAYQLYATETSGTSSGFFRIKFMNKDGSRIGNFIENANAQGVKTNITPVNHVWRIGVQGSGGAANIRIYEFDVFGEDKSPPEVPQGVTATIENDERVVVTWNPVSDIDLAGYYVYRNNVKISNMLTTTTYIDNTVQPNVTYSYQVSTVDELGNESARSTPVVVRIEQAMPLSVNFLPAGNAIIVQVSGGKPPYTVSMVSPPYNETMIGNRHTIRNLELSTDYTVTVTDSDGEMITEIINTGDRVGYVPPDFPDSTSIFQKILNSFGSAGQIGLAIILAAVALAVIIILGLYGWRLTKRWLASVK